MHIDNSEFKNAELSYRRGYQQGAYDALQRMLAGANPEEIKIWVEVEIYRWRIKKLMKRTPPPRRR